MMGRPALLAAIASFMAFQAQGQTQAQAGGQKWSKDPTSQCEFVSPVSLTAGPTYWVGECPANKATGFGMLRRRDGNQAGPAFYGEMRAGIPTIGVIDNEGYRVGHFKNGDIGDAELEFQVRMDAFEAAVKAAREVSSRYAKQGNQASARLYEGVAKQLDEQIE
ncbi:hypothetical protein KX729_13515 [Rhizobium sp. XQZ8]|uniref:hypothetical protein n=1 Tax=Rhizobium populisoli TaxID=2859785 RepID=UPI001CA4C545|nr:hypothetical protein [Rhizobium populisoli]MBW6422470.1 hypothetical protein [Rhizobium populisoli]